MKTQLALIQKLTYYLIFFILSIFVLIEAKHLLFPIAFGILIAYLIFPISKLLEEKLKFPRALAILVTLIVIIALLIELLNILLHQIGFLLADFPELKKQALLNVDAIQSFIENKFGVTDEAQDIWIKSKISEIFENGDKYVTLFLSKATGTIGSIILIPIFAFFMLFYRDEAQNFIMQIVKQKQGKLTEKLLKQISRVTIKYVGGIIVVVLIISVSHCISLSIMGLKYAIIIGILSGLFSFIPYFGTISGSIVPIVFSLLTYDNPLIIFWILGYYIVVMFIDHNVLTPLIVGGNVHLNPFITILSVIIGGMIWGIPGMLVVIPVIAIIKIICDNVEGLAPWGYILGAGKTVKVPFEKLRLIVQKRKLKESLKEKK